MIRKTFGVGSLAIAMLAPPSAQECGPRTPLPDGGPASVTLHASGKDDTARLIKAIKDHDSVTIDGALVVNGVVDLTGFKHKTISWTKNGKLRRTIKSSKRVWQVLLLDSVDDIALINPWIEGPLSSCTYDPDIEAQHGIDMFEAANVTIHGGRIEGVYGDGINIAGRSGSHDIGIADITVSCVGRNAVSNTGARRVHVGRGTFQKAGLWVFDVEPDKNDSVDNFHVDDARIGTSQYAWLNARGPYFSCKVNNVVFNHPVFLGLVLSPTIAKCALGDVSVYP